MKTTEEILESIINAIIESESRNLIPKRIVMHSSLYHLLSANNKPFNKILGLNIEIDNLAPKETFYIVNKEDMTKDEIWWLIGSTFHSQSGLFLNKKQSEQVAEYILKLRDDVSNTTN